MLSQGGLLTNTVFTMESAKILLNIKLPLIGSNEVLEPALDKELTVLLLVVMLLMVVVLLLMAL